DTGQTFPSFIYLIPAIMLFGINDVAVIFSILIYTLVPVIRYTIEGLRGVPPELTEAADMSGATRWQKLVNVQLPIALPTLAVGFNQAIMFAFFMVIIAAFIGTQDLGQELQRTLAGTDLGKNFVLGMCVVMMLSKASAISTTHMLGCEPAPGARDGVMLDLAKFERPMELGSVLTPGLPLLPHGVERHLVPGGGSRGIEIRAGDEITVIDRQGLQPAELVFFTPDGRSDTAMIGASGTGPAGGLQASLLQGDGSAKRTLKALDKAGFDIGHAQAARIFPDGSAAGDSRNFHAQVDGLLIVCAVGDAMLPEAQNTLTDLAVYVRRADPGQAKTAHQHDPLADPLQDLNIQPGEAQAYEVKAGEFIQILDVQGRECSDFQALSLRALDDGQEREIDPTTTRSLMGSLYPNPGIFSKYWTQDQEPLIEIVQDTCGRHDTFGLACSARYYDDLGYPGHVNCTDNMNLDLARFDVRPRGGWPAINFFFNTMLDDTHAIGMDDPWSRPGDYVLLRALTDLVCVSTACPCDVDPANGWNPTDIQVRTYAANEDFKRSVGFRMTTDSPVEQTKETGFHTCFARHTRDFAEYNGYWLANRFPAHGTIAEYWACREKAVVMDLSPLRKYEVTGPDAEALMQMCVTRNMKKLSVGQVVYTAVCHEHGGMIDDGTVYRLGENNFRW
ncbi:MAG: DUF1989 domain-containing protein, partial [Pseudomonadota bacterium]